MIPVHFGLSYKENSQNCKFALLLSALAWWKQWPQTLRPDGKTMFYLHSIGMLPNYQDKGYGSKLLSYFPWWKYSKEVLEVTEKNLYIKKLYVWFLITDKGNPRACHVYEKLGGKNDYKDEIVYVYDYEKGDK